MKELYYDSEWFLPTPGCQAPPLVCSQWCLDDSDPQLIHVRDPALYRLLRGFLEDPYTLWSSHNGCTDMAVLCAQWPDLIPLVFEAYRSNRIVCTETRHRLIHIAQGTFKKFDMKKGSFSLEGAAKYFDLDVPLDKTSRWRTRYGELYPVDVPAWPEDAKTYALGDPVAQRAVHRAQDAYAKERNIPLDDQFAKSYDSFWTYLCTCWGLRTDPVQVEKYLAEVKEDLERAKVSILKAGLLRYNGTKDTKKAAAHMVECCRALGVEPPKTKGGGVALDKDAIEQFGDELLEDYQAYVSADARIKRVEDLRHGAITPMQPGYKAVGADTARMSCIGNNSEKSEWVSAWRTQAQNPPKTTGYRECVIPRDGRYIWSVDWVGVEPRYWTNWCIDNLGFSKMGDELNNNLDPYLVMAAKMAGVTKQQAFDDYSGANGKDAKDAMKKWRTAAKPVVLGAPAGMGGAKVMLTARKMYGVAMTLEQAKRYLVLMKQEYPELQKYLDWANRMLQGKETCSYTYPKSNRMRGGLWYTALTNGTFQGGARDLFGAAGGQISYECYVDTSSVLFGSRILVPLHDEFLGESDIDVAHLCAARVSEIMVQTGQVWCPHLKNSWGAPPALMDRWSKNAEPKYVDGKLVPWYPD
jgi:hypothetical protein